jgi:hypothetical protein
MTPEEIENVKVSIVKEIQTMEANKSIIQDEADDIKRQIIVLDGKAHELRTSIRKSTQLIREKKHDTEMLDVKFWQKKRGY